MLTPMGLRWFAVLDAPQSGYYDPDGSMSPCNVARKENQL